MSSVSRERRAHRGNVICKVCFHLTTHVVTHPPVSSFDRLLTVCAVCFQVDNSAWECPPGLGVCPLDVIFGTCKIIHNYLRSCEEHVVVSPEAGSGALA